MRKICIIFLFALTCFNLSAQTAFPTDSVKKRPWTAAAYTLVLNGGVWAYDRYITKSEFAEISYSTMKSNVKTGFVWDSDRLATNHLGHPYNGGLYFLGARSCGLNYWQSLPYATAGSLLWELFAEKEPPGLNDLIATPLAGAAFGEVFHRTSNYILDDRTRGPERIAREVAAAVINPVGFVDRFVTGKLWKSNTSSIYDCDRIPLNLTVSAVDRFMSDGADVTRGHHYPSLQIDLEYGDAMDASENRPFDYFFGSTTMHLGSSNTQPLFCDINITGRLWGREIETGSDDSEAVFGIWQQYDFYHTRSAREDEDNPIFNFSETVAAGPGIVFRQTGNNTVFHQALFADIIGLGAVENSNIFIIERHYNMGSGFALKSLSSLRLWNRVSLSFQAKLFYLNTWGDYTSRDDVAAGLLDPLYTDTMGDKSYSWAFVLSPTLRVNVAKHWGITLSASRLGRDSHYKSFPDSKARTTDVRFGIYYNL